MFETLACILAGCFSGLPVSSSWSRFPDCVSDIWVYFENITTYRCFTFRLLQWTCLGYCVANMFVLVTSGIGMQSHKPKGIVIDCNLFRLPVWVTKSKVEETGSHCLIIAFLALFVHLCSCQWSPTTDSKLRLQPVQLLEVFKVCL